ncbi:hypothetical protein BC835DRAFT_1009165 [Cytidiella melzeri]|nr:hypothetical protein BC835DRAFT_1009165 [Cytidiella melzeri]
MNPTLSSRSIRHRTPARTHKSQMYTPALVTLPSVIPPYSSLRSSAQLQSPSSHPFYIGTYSHQSSPVERFQSGHTSSFSSTSSSMHPDMATREQPHDFHEPHYTFATSKPQHYQSQVPRSFTWGQDKQHGYHEFSTPSHFGPQVSSDSRYPDPAGYSGSYFDNASKDHPYLPGEIGSFYSGEESVMTQEPALTAYTAQAHQAVLG